MALSAIDPSTFLKNIVIKDVSLASLPDNTYEGQYTIPMPPGQDAMNRHFDVLVKVAGGAYDAITIKDPSSLDSDANFVAFKARIISSQSLLGGRGERGHVFQCRHGQGRRSGRDPQGRSMKLGATIFSATLALSLVSTARTIAAPVEAREPVALGLDVGTTASSALMGAVAGSVCLDLPWPIRCP